MVKLPLHKAISVAILGPFLDQAGATCLIDSTANQVAQNYAALFQSYSPALADQVLTPDFTDQTDSVNWLINNGTDCPKPLGSLTYSSRAAFEAGQATQQDMPFQILNVYHDCFNVFVRWKFPIQPQQVQGISILQTEFNLGNLRQPYLIKTLYAEFNVGAFMVDMGLYTPGVSPAACGAQKRDADVEKMVHLPEVPGLKYRD